MELALLLVVLVVFELVFTIWFLARQRSIFLDRERLDSRVDLLEKHVARLAESLGDVEEVSPVDISGVSPDDVAAAEKMLAALGYKRD